MDRLLLPSLLLLATAPAANAQLSLDELASIDLAEVVNPASASYVGKVAHSVAWDGTDLYVAGDNASPLFDTTGIVKVADALGAATLESAFHVLPTPPFRGYSGLDVRAGTLYAAYDVGSASPIGITAYDASGTLVWSFLAHGSTGPGYDPGFPGGNPSLGEGLAWTSTGFDRRALLDGSTGAAIWTLIDGFAMTTMEGDTWRDMDFDDDTGDIWLREGNNLIRGTRSGDNALSSVDVIFDQVPEIDDVPAQNVVYVNDDVGGDFVIYNDRKDETPGQDFSAVVKIVLPDGTPTTLDLGSFSPATGNGHYDFSWDPASKTLAILDAANARAHVFGFMQPNLGTTYCTSTINSTGTMATLFASGSAVASLNDFHLTASDLPQNQFGYFLASLTQDLIPMPGGSQGNLCLGGTIGRFNAQIQNSGSAGEISITVDLTNIPVTPPVAVMAGESWNFQGWFRDLNPTQTSNFTDGVEVTFL